MLFQKYSIEWWAVKVLAVAVILGVIGYGVSLVVFFINVYYR